MDMVIEYSKSKILKPWTITFKSKEYKKFLRTTNNNDNYDDDEGNNND
jgi:hypothetical protein